MAVFRLRKTGGGSRVRGGDPLQGTVTVTPTKGFNGVSDALVGSLAVNDVLVGAVGMRDASVGNMGVDDA
jgi:2C-methyl-D-erythritol 2,4-cyclodiphosphate synthase